MRVKDQVPSAFAVVVPRAVLPSNTVSVAPASAPLPVNLGRTVVVMLSPTVPVSLAASSAGAARALMVASTVTALAAE